MEISSVYKIGKASSLSATVGVLKRVSPKLLIVAAGDGTISRVMSILAGSSVEVGIVPMGTTNNFARSLGMPLDVKEAMRVIAASSSRKVDLGKVGDRYFANVVGIGVSALVANQVTDDQKRRFGRLAYALTGIKCLIRHKPFLVTITDKDGELSLSLKTHQIIVANGRYHAGKEIATDVRLDNNELVVFPIGGRSKSSYVKGTVSFYLGKRRKARYASYLIARNIKIHTSGVQSSEVDGEVYRRTPLRFSVASKMVRVRYGGVV